MRSMLNFTMRYVPIDTSSGPLSEPGAAGKYFGMGIGFLHLADDVDILIGELDRIYTKKMCQLNVLHMIYRCFYLSKLFFKNTR